MPKHIADQLQAASLHGLLEAKHLDHLRVRRNGGLLVLESGADDSPVAHARFRRLGAHIWRLEMPTHTNTSQVTPLRGQMRDLLDCLVDQFPWTLDPVA
jgi:hypothetical protein